MKGIRLAGILLCGIFLMTGSAAASGEFSYKNTVVAHRAPDGGIGFAAGTDMPVLKVFAPDGSAPSYYIYFAAEKGAFRKEAEIHARGFADGKPIMLVPVGSEAEMHRDKWFSGWYRLSAEDAAQMAVSAEFSFQLVGAGEKVLWQQKGKLKTAEAMQKITRAEPSMYLREGNIRAESADASVQADSRPRVFLPNVSPETVKIRIYEHLEELKKDKETKADWMGFGYSPHTNDHIVSVIGDSINEKWPLITFETLPYQGGTLLAMMKDQQGYFNPTKSFYTVGMMTSDGFVVSVTGVWRSLADQWDGFLNDLYRQMSPHAEFPFALVHAYKKGEGNHFFITMPRDGTLLEGDEILSVDGAPAAWYKPNELRLVLLQKQGAVTFRIKRADGTERDVSVTPEMRGPEMPAAEMERETKDVSIEGKAMDVSAFGLITQGNFPQLFQLMDESYRRMP